MLDVVDLGRLDQTCQSIPVMHHTDLCVGFAMPHYTEYGRKYPLITYRYGCYTIIIALPAIGCHTVSVGPCT